MLTVEPHPLLDLRAFVTRFPQRLGELRTPDELLAFFSPQAQRALASEYWRAGLLVLILGALSYGGALLIAHLRNESDPGEQLRTRWVLAGFSLFALLGTTELGFSVFRLGSVGSVVAAMFLAIALLSLNVLEKSRSLMLLLAVTGSIAVAIAAAPIALPSRISSRWPLATLVAVYCAYRVYLRAAPAPARFLQSGLARALHEFWLAGWGFDWLYDRLLVRPFVRFARFNRDDCFDAIYEAIADAAAAGYGGMRRLQNGRVRRYAGWIAVGSVASLAVAVLA